MRAATAVAKADGGSGVPKIGGLFELYRAGGQHHWVLRDWDGEIVARNGGYATRAAAVRDIERLTVLATRANVAEA